MNFQFSFDSNTFSSILFVVIVIIGFVGVIAFLMSQNKKHTELLKGIVKISDFSFLFDGSQTEVELVNFQLSDTDRYLVFSYKLSDKSLGLRPPKTRLYLALGAMDENRFKRFLHCAH